MKLTKKLKAKLFDLIWTHSLTGCALVSEQGVFLKANEKFCELTGYHEEELIGKTFQSITHPDDLAVDEQLAKDIAEGDKSHYYLQKRYIHKRGHSVWFELDVIPVKKEDGSFEMFLSQGRPLNNKHIINPIKAVAIKEKTSKSFIKAYWSYILIILSGLAYFLSEFFANLWDR